MGSSSYCLSLSLYIMSSYLMRYSVLHELNTLDARMSWLTCGVMVVDAESFRSTCFGRDAYRNNHCIDIVTTLHSSVNCSTIICSPTVIFAILRETSSEHYGPRVYSTPYFQPYNFLLRCTFRLQISLCKQS